MKKWTGKRVLSVLLALTMCLSMGTMQVQAETGSPGIEVKNSTQTTGLDFSDDSVDAEAITSYIENNAYRDRYGDWRIDLVITLPATMESEEAWANLRKGITEAKKQGYGIYVDLTLKGIEAIPSRQVGKGVFQGLYGLESVVLPSVTSLGNYAFSGCGSIYEITFGSPLSTVEVDGFSSGYEQYTTLTLASGQKAMNQKLDGETPVGWEADDQESAFGTNVFCGKTFKKIQCPHDIEEMLSFEANEADAFLHIKTCAHCETEVTEDHTLNENGVCTGCGAITSHLYVGGIPVTGANADDVLGDGDAGATVRYDAATNTLTLENAVIQGAEAVRGAGIYATGNDTLVLQLEGTNQVTGTYSNDLHVDAGVYTDGILQIQGSGALTTTSKIATETETPGVPKISAGIFARGGMSMVSGTLHAIGGGATDTSSGIYAFYYNGYELDKIKIKRVSISGGTATLESGELFTVRSGILESKGMDQRAVMGVLDLSGYPYVKWTQTEDGDPCVIPFDADGMMTGYLHMEPGDYRIAPQPATENGYTVEAQMQKGTDWDEVTEPTSYQWYQLIQKQVVLDPTEADQVGGLIIEYGTYSEEGYWEPVYIEDEAYLMMLAIPAEAGDRILFTMRDNTEATIVADLADGNFKANIPGCAFEVQEEMLHVMDDTDENAPKYTLFMLMGENDYGVQATVTSSEGVSSIASVPNRFNSTTPGNYYGRVIVGSAEGDGVAAIMDSQPFFFIPIYTITFDASVGQCDTVSKDTEMGTGKFEASYELPVAVSEDYTFLGWVTEEGHLVTEETVFEKNTTVKAKWAVKVNQAPVAKEGLTYTGGAQELIAAGTAGKNGVMMYSLSKDGSYDTAIPVGTGVGSYTVWYYVAALDGSGFEDSEALAVSVGIGKAVGSATVTMDGWVYKDSPADPVSVSTTNGTDNVTYLYESTDGKGYSSAIVPVDAGAYKVTATFAENDLYLSCEAEATFTISPKSIVGAQILLDAEKLVYTGQELEQIVQSVTVGDLNVDTYRVLNNKNTKVGVYELTVEGSGNFGGKAVTTYTIHPDAAALEGLTESNVTSLDREEVEAIKNMLEEANTSLADEDTLEAWKELQETCEKLLGQLDKVREQLGQIRETIQDKTEQNVTSSDQEKLKEAIQTIDTLSNVDNLTEEEKAELSSAKDKMEALLEVISEAEKATETERVKNAEDITSQNVTPADVESLEKALEDLENAQEKYGGNYTEAEGEAIQAEIDRIAEALQILEDVETFEEYVIQLPVSVEADDVKNREAIREVERIYGRLNEHGRSMLDEKSVEKWKNLLEELVDYQIVEGAGSKWTKDSGEDMRFKANGPAENVSGIEVDGHLVDPKNYTIESGSTIITVKAEYLQTLSVGVHTFKVKYTDGETGCLFTIQKAPEKHTGTDKTEDSNVVTAPMTGDVSPVAGWIFLMAVSLAGMVALEEIKHRKYHC